MHLLRKLRRLSFSDHCLLVEAAFFSGVAGLMLTCLPFRWIAPWLGQHMAATSETHTDSDRVTAGRIQRVVRIAGKYVPWRAQCLAQAITGAMMLRRRKMAGTVYLGINRAEGKEAIAHAWLRSGSTIVTGGDGREDHAVISTFAFGPVELTSGQ